ncbi:MAG: methylated-DNA--[protein]-cysteine S-methyltransferase [Caldilineae bacterium]|nr:MAG: methylated-DNA--[protein]-cysteine S-methyltransferase [Caldilineae bacterium]
MFCTFYESPIGFLEVAGTADAIVSVRFCESPGKQTDVCELIQRAVAQLGAYFAGELREFDLPLAPQGTAFQKRVWDYLLSIPYGRTVSYRQVAEALGNPAAIRAVGAANGANPIPIIIPCHRVVGSDGSLVGYGGGLWRKEWLLRHEGVLLL